MESYTPTSARLPLLLCGIDYVAIGVIVAMVAFAAAAGGGEEPPELAVLIVGGAILALLALVRLMLHPTRALPTAPVLVLGAFGLLAILQATPLPTAVVESMSPRRATISEAAMVDPPAWLTLSYSAHASREGLRMFMLGCAVFLSVTVCCREADRVHLLLAGLFLVGVGEAGLSLAQIATGADGIYWAASAEREVRSGSFVNHSNFAQLLNLTAGAGLGWLFQRHAERRGDTEGMRFALGRASTTTWLILAGLTLHGAAMIACLSRTGIIATIVSAFTVLLILRKQQGRRPSRVVIGCVVASAAIIAVGVDSEAPFADAFLSTSDGPFAGRSPHLAAASKLAIEHAPMGAGLNIYGLVIPAYEPTRMLAVNRQADNDYLQLAAESGVFGVVVVALFIWLVVRRLSCGIRAIRAPVDYCLYGVVYGLVAVAIHSVTDYGQRLPAVFCVTAALCGLCWSLRSPSEPPAATPAGSRWAWLSVVLASAFSLAMLGSAYSSYREREAFLSCETSQTLSRAPQEGQGAKIDRPVDIRVLACANRAASLSPSNIQYTYWLRACEWRDLLATHANLAWAPDDPVLLRRSALDLANQLAADRQACPSHAAACVLEAQIRAYAGDAQAVRLARAAVELAPSDVAVLFDSARVEMLQSPRDTDRLQELFHRVVAAAPHSYAQVARVCVVPLDRLDWALNLAGDETGRLDQLVRLLRKDETNAETVREIEGRIVAVLEERMAAGRAMPNEMARLAAARASEGREEEAIDLYRAALATEYGQVGRRLALAELLLKRGRPDEAEREARIVLRLRPENKRAQRLLDLAIAREALPAKAE